jgi:hypothetical protein
MPLIRRGAARSNPLPTAVPPSSCLCGEETVRGWAAWAISDSVSGLEDLQKFWAGLKPAARASALKITLSTAIPEVGLEGCSGSKGDQSTSTWLAQFSV